MRIHRLGLEAIGPFPGRHDIDLDELSAGGLFLLEGPTGAGKSTLIDAIIYGLYGTLGSAQLDERLPSAHAPDTEPVIEVVFSTGAGIHRVRRTPPYDRPKRRGEGTVRQNATARLWRLSAVDDPAGEALSASAQEVGIEVRGLVGLDRAQFSQTVVLPQGRFATFLRAKPEERRQVLQEVFGSAVYEQVQAELAELARGARRALDAAQRDVDAAVAAFGGLLDDHATVTALSEAGEALDAGCLEALTADLLAALRDAAETTERARLRDEEAERTAQRAVAAERELATALDRRRGLLDRRARLTEREPALTEQRGRLAAGRRAAGTASALRSHDSAAARGRAAAEALTRAGEDAGTGPDGDLVQVEDLDALAEVVTGLTVEQGALADPLDLETALPARAESLEREAAALSARRTALAQEQVALDLRPQQRDTLTAALGELRRTATPVAAAEAVVADRRRVRDAARLAERHAAELVEAEQAVAVAGLVATEALAHENAVRLRWINGVAGNLAGELRDGCACPVCGSTEHPAPADVDADHAGLADVDAATARRALADQQLTAADQDRVRAAERLAAQRELAGTTTSAEAQEALAAALAEVAAATRTAGRIAEDEAAIVAFDAETAALGRRHGQAEQALATDTERLRSATERLAADRERCRRAAGDAPSVAARAGQLATRLATARTLLEARREHEDAAREHARTAAGLTQALAEAGFPDADAARAARLATAELTALQTAVEAYDAELGAVTAGLAEPAVAALTGDEVVDLPATEARHEKARAALAAATRAAAETAGSLDRCTRARTCLLDALSTHCQVAADAAPVVRMSELAAGGEGNARATTLATYVLLRRFEDVVAAANERLAVMSTGRFELMRKDSREGRARRTGLGLEVRDHHTETNRDPHTLSGGETFYVSLCLALGLADVVTSEAGGIALDTLFIDEGFGSLDQHTLDGVLGELTRLQAGGRVVGIVSHVTELKDRIAERIEVAPSSAGGSTLRVRA